MEGTQHNIFQEELLDHHMLDEDTKLLHNLSEWENKWQIKDCSHDPKFRLCDEFHVLNVIELQYSHKLAYDILIMKQ